MKTKNTPAELNDYLFEILDQAKNGISITDPNQEDNPLIYVNQSFTDLFGYEFDEVIGKNCRFLQGEDRNQIALPMIRNAIDKQISVTAVLRNYSKSGRLIYNEIMISPIFEKNTKNIKYFLGVQKDVTKEQTILQNLKRFSDLEQFRIFGKVIGKVGGGLRS